MSNIPLPAVRKMVQTLQTLPGIGQRTAQRLAFYLLKLPASEVRRMIEEIIKARESIHFCKICFSLSEGDECTFCRDPERATGQVCVVEDPINVFVLEQTGVYRGRYHVLMGTLSPLRGIGPEQLKIAELMKRLTDENLREVILALNSTVEGEATAIFLTRALKPHNVKVTRLASGVPMGADLEYLDELTLTRAFQNRIEA